MSVHEPPSPDGERPEAEPFLERWSRRKVRARTGAVTEPDAQANDVASAPAPEGPERARPPLPDLESLGADSDYSAFMAPGVDEGLRRQALRKLFSSPQYNVRDGLDDYCDDFTQWKSLGDIVTADMRHHLERAARLAERALEEDTGPPAEAAVAASPSHNTEPGDDPGEEPPESHDQPERTA